MRRHNSSEIRPPLDPSRRKRPLLLSTITSSNNNMCAPSSRRRRRSPSPTFKTTPLRMRNFLCLLVTVTLSSSVFLVVRYHSITTALLVTNDVPLVRRRRRATHSNERRKRPPTLLNTTILTSVQYNVYESTTLLQNTTKMTNFKTMDANDFCGTHAGIAAASHGYMATPLNNHSRVVITNILHPLGVSLALRLHLECHVGKIIGIDPLLPNTRHARMQMMEPYALLQNYIPTLPKLDVPEVGLPLEEIMTRHEPTHIVHLSNAYASFLEPVVTMQQLLDSRLVVVPNTKVPHLTLVTVKSDDNNAVVKTNALQVLASTYNAMYRLDHTVGLRLPHVYGEYNANSWISNLTLQSLADVNATLVNKTVLSNQQQQQQDDKCLFIDDAVDAVVAAMQVQPPHDGLATFHIDSGTTLAMLQQELSNVVSKTTSSLNVTPTNNNTTTRYWLGWTPSTNMKQAVQSLVSYHLARKYPYGHVAQQLAVPTPPQRVLFPCASECSRSSQCQASTVLDEALKVSRRLTRGCKYVIYTVDLWANVKDLPSSGQPSEDDEENAKWCRLAFVSDKSPLVQRQVFGRNTTALYNATISSQDSNKFNGKVQYKNWTLVYVNGHASEMSEAEYTLLKLTPKRFFSETVSRALFVQPHQFPVPSYEALAGYFKTLDPRAREEGHIKEYRSGSKIFRFLPKPAKKARRVLFSSLEASFSDIPPKSPVTVYVQDIIKREGIRPVSERLAPQLNFYTYAAHFVQTSPRRPEDEIRSTIYKEFPFQWLKTAMMVHDLREEESTQLRCEWYDEHLFWGNSHLEDVSLAFILAKRRIMGRHDVEEDPGWFPIMNTNGEEPERLVNTDDMELFLRILPKPRTSKS